MTEKQAYKILTNTPIRAKENHTEYSKALHIALGALEKRIPNITNKRYGNCKCNWYEHTCAVCGSGVDCGQRFCGGCGQALLWGGDTDV